MSFDTANFPLTVSDELMQNIQPMLISHPPAQPARKKKAPSARKKQTSAVSGELPVPATAATPMPGSGLSTTHRNSRGSDPKKKARNNRRQDSKKAKPKPKNNGTQVTKATPFVVAVSVDSKGNYDAQSQDESPTPSIMARIMDHDSITPFEVGPVQRARTSVEVKLQQHDTWNPTHVKNMGAMHGPVEQWLMDNTEVDGLMEQLLVNPKAPKGTKVTEKSTDHDAMDLDTPAPHLRASLSEMLAQIKNDQDPAHQCGSFGRPDYVSPYPPLAVASKEKVPSSNGADDDDQLWSASKMQREKRAASSKTRTRRRNREPPISQAGLDAGVAGKAVSAEEPGKPVKRGHGVGDKNGKLATIAEETAEGKAEKKGPPKKPTRRNLTADAASKPDGDAGRAGVVGRSGARKEKAATMAPGVKRGRGGRMDVEDTLEERDGNVYLHRELKTRKERGE